MSESQRFLRQWRAAGVSPLIEVANLTRYIYRKTSPPVKSRNVYGTFDLVETSGAWRPPLAVSSAPEG